MYKKCENCYKDGKVPNEESCKKCEDDLNAKEQECEELKEKLRTKARGWANVNDQILKEVDQLKAEHSLLKDEYKILEDNLDSRTRDFEDVIDGYKQTLTEIKEIIQSDYCTEIGSCEFCAEVGNCLNRKILQKISECEGSDEN